MAQQTPARTPAHKMLEACQAMRASALREISEHAAKAGYYAAQDISREAGRIANLDAQAAFIREYINLCDWLDRPEQQALTPAERRAIRTRFVADESTRHADSIDAYRGRNEAARRILTHLDSTDDKQI